VTTYAPQTTDPKAPAWARASSHLAGSLETLRDGINVHWPHRDHASDGTIGNAAHLATGSGSDHNAWLNSTVRALDIDVDGIDAAWLAEQLRLLGAAGDHRLTGGGYVIYNRLITSSDFRRWMPYTGDDPHTAHLHVSVSRNPVGYEDRGPWHFLDLAQQPDHPGKVAPVTLSGHDATGADAGFRAHYGDEGPKIEHLQHELNVQYPAYSHLTEDGVYGPATSQVLDEFSERVAHEAATPAADRAPLSASDGRDVGPRTARALDRHGIV
jgi:hypothetical protein